MKVTPEILEALGFYQRGHLWIYNPKLQDDERVQIFVYDDVLLLDWYGAGPDHATLSEVSKAMIEYHENHTEQNTRIEIESKIDEAFR